MPERSYFPIRVNHGKRGDTTEDGWKMNACGHFSLRFDESNDIGNVKINNNNYVKMLFGDMSAREALLRILPLNGQTRMICLSCSWFL